MKKFIMILILLFTGTLAACSNEVKVLGENEINKQKDVQKYISELQNSKIDYKGYKVFESPNSKSIVVISSGEAGGELKLGKIETSSVDTAINIEKSNDKTDEKNPYIVVEIEKIQGAFYVYDSNGKEYEGTGYYEE